MSETNSKQQIPIYTNIFILADEINPFRGKVIRRVIVNPKMATEAARKGIKTNIFSNPEIFGFIPTDSNKNITVGRHAMNIKPSQYISASRIKPYGSTRFIGEPFWIDERKAIESGSTFHEVDEIIDDLKKIKLRLKDGSSRVNFDDLITKVINDKEVLIKGRILPSHIKSSTSIKLTRYLQSVQILSFTISAVKISEAISSSMRDHSIRPLEHEATQQFGGWAGAWAGVRIGSSVGALAGIETGPGAILTGAAGGLVGGISGYFAGSWVSNHLE